LRTGRALQVIIDLFLRDAVGPGAEIQGGESQPNPSRRAVLRGALVAGAGTLLARHVTPKHDNNHPKHAHPQEHAHTLGVPSGGPLVVQRRQWGANEHLRRGPVQYDARFDKVVIHHTGTPNGPQNWASQVRSIYEYETSHGYQDIAYHYLVDPNGVIYEGRWARNFKHNENPDATNGRGSVVHGAHAIGHNNRTLGVALLGNYMSANVSPAALEGVAALLAWQCARWGIDPRGSGVYVDDIGGREFLENVCPHDHTTQTLCPGTGVLAALPAIREATAVHMGGVPRRRPVAHTAPPPPRPHEEPRGFWVVAPDGRTVAFNGAPAVAHRAPLRSPIAGVAGSAQGGGFWAYAADGGVFTFGDATFHGSAAGQHLRAPIVGMDSSATGNGYWLVARDGGVFAFGDAPYHGSVARTRLSAPIVAIARTSTGHGYVLLGADGGVFSFGDSTYHGSMSGTRLSAPAVDIVSVHKGYLIATLDGGVFALGAATYRGNARGKLGGAGVVAIAAKPDGSEYILLTNNGHTFKFGTTRRHQSLAAAVPQAVGIATAHSALRFS
jgi:hypothetical protein